jgi:3-dehydroquinate dehydratase / shikimate dehydrogenase
MSRLAALVASLGVRPSSDEAALPAVPDVVTWLQVRADVLGDIDPAWLRSRFSGRLIYSLRSTHEGGNFQDSDEVRRARLITAAKSFDLVELEGERDLAPGVLAAIPPHRRLISWHGPPADAGELRSRFERLAGTEARVYKLIPRADRPGDELEALLFLESLGRPDVIAFASGPTGFWTRLVAPRLGAPFVFASPTRGTSAEGQPDVLQLIEDYGFPSSAPIEEIFGIVGNPVFHSLSPRLHNATYRALERPALFVPFQVTSWNEFWDTMVESGKVERLGMRVQGLTVASPHKEAVLQQMGACSPTSRRAASSNIVVRNHSHWTADTTDPEGVLVCLRKRGIRLGGKDVAVVGCGGAGRAVAAALDHAGARVTLVNRGARRGRLAVRLLGLPFVPLSEFRADRFGLVIHATPVGRDDDGQLFDVDRLCVGAVVVDLAYGSRPTPLVTRTRALGHVAIDGLEVLLTQVRCQFHLMTGKTMPGSIGLATAADGHRSVRAAGGMGREHR